MAQRTILFIWYLLNTINGGYYQNLALDYILWRLERFFRANDANEASN